LTIGALSAVAAYVVHSAVDYNLHIPANALLVAVVFGIIAAPSLSDESAEFSAFRRFAPRLTVGLLAATLLIACSRVLPGEYYADQARVALWDEDAETAAEAGLKALEYERQNPKIYFYLGRALRASAAELTSPEEQRPFYEAAVSAMAAAQRVAPLDGTFALEQATLYIKLGRFEEAERMFAIAKGRDPRAIYILQEYRAFQNLWKMRDAAPAPADAAPGGY
jgi:tetratricopeptide (TPR) repeat protein